MDGRSRAYRSIMTTTLAPTRYPLLGVLAPLPALGNAAWALAVPYATSDPPEVWLPAVAAAPGRMELALAFLLVTMLTAVPSVLVLGALARRVAPRLGAVATVVAFVGAVGVGVDGLAYDGFAIAAAGLDPATLTALYGRYDTLLPVLVGGTLFLGVPLGTLLLGAALVTGRAVPRWAATAIMGGVLVAVFGGYVAMPLLVTGWLLVALGSAVAGAAYARRQA